MTDTKQYFYPYCCNWQGWCVRNGICNFKYENYSFRKHKCKYYKRCHPDNSQQPNMMPQETKEWLNSLVNRNGDNK